MLSIIIMLSLLVIMVNTNIDPKGGKKAVLVHSMFLMSIFSEKICDNLKFIQLVL